METSINFTGVVPQLVLILSGSTCNAIYRNSDEAYVFCSTLPFQQTPRYDCMSNRSRVTHGFVKTVVRTPPKKAKKKWTKTQIYSLTSSSLSKAVHWTFSFSKYHPFAAKHAFILSTYILLWWFQIILLESVQRSFGSPGSPKHLFCCSSHAVHVSTMKTTRIWKAFFNRAIVSAFNYFNLAQNFTV